MFCYLELDLVIFGLGLGFRSLGWFFEFSFRLICLNFFEWFLNSLKRVLSFCRKFLMDWMSCRFFFRKFLGTK